MLANPVRTLEDIERIPDLTPEHVPFITEAVQTLVSELGGINGGTPLIGFAGAPFTVASYLIEGRPSRTYEQTKRMMLAEPALFAALLDRLMKRELPEGWESALPVFESGKAVATRAASSPVAV